MVMDLRRKTLRAGLEQLTSAQLWKILNHGDPMVYDTFNFDEVTGRY